MLNILIIDDQAGFRETIEEILTRKHLHVTTARDAEEGLMRLNEAFDLICVDFNMPGQNGYGFCREVKTNPELRQYATIPIIGIGSFPENKREYLHACFEKPFSFDNFYSTLSKVAFGGNL